MKAELWMRENAEYLREQRGKRPPGRPPKSLGHGAPADPAIWGLFRERSKNSKGEGAWHLQRAQGRGTRCAWGPALLPPPPKSRQGSRGAAQTCAPGRWALTVLASPRTDVPFGFGEDPRQAELGPCDLCGHPVPPLGPERTCGHASLPVGGHSDVACCSCGRMGSTFLGQGVKEARGGPGAWGSGFGAPGSMAGRSWQEAQLGPGAWCGTQDEVRPRWVTPPEVREHPACPSGICVVGSWAVELAPRPETCPRLVVMVSCQGTVGCSRPPPSQEEVGAALREAPAPCTPRLPWAGGPQETLVAEPLPPHLPVSSRPCPHIPRGT